MMQRNLAAVFLLCGMLALPTPSALALDGVDEVEHYFYSPHFGELPQEWEHSFTVQLGYSEDTGQTADIDLTASFEAVSSFHVYRNRLQVDGDYGESDPGDGSGRQVTSRDYTLDEHLEYHFHSRYYAFAGYTWEQNRIIGLDERISWRGGAGMFILQSDAAVLRLEAGYAQVGEKMDAPNTDQTYGATVGAVKWLWNISEQNSLTVEYHYFHNLDNRFDRRTDLTAELDASLTDALSLVFTYEYEHDSDPVYGVKETQRSLTAGLEYDF